MYLLPNAQPRNMILQNLRFKHKIFILAHEKSASGINGNLARAPSNYIMKKTDKDKNQEFQYKTKPIHKITSLQ